MPSDAPTIRPATAADAATIADLLRDMVDGLGGDTARVSSPEDILAHGFGEGRCFDVLLAEADGGAVGFVVTFLTYSTWTAELGLYVQDIHVSPSHRGTGLADRLLARAAQSGWARGARHLRLSVEPGNTAARKFYRRCGLEARLNETIYQVSGPDFGALANGADDD